MLHELPRPIRTSMGDDLHPEYPSSAFVDDSTLLVSDGHGSLQLLDITSCPARLINSYDMLLPEASGSLRSNIPFKVHTAHKTSPTTCITVISSKHHPPLDQSTKKRINLTNVQYDIWAASINLELLSQDKPVPLDIMWHRRGSNVPTYVAFDNTRRVFILIGNSAYRSLEAPAVPSYTPAADEIAPIPRHGENLDRESGNVVTVTDTPTKPPPYSWTQTNETVTVAFPLPASTSKTDIKVTFSPRTLTLLVHGNDERTPVPLPKYTTKALWDGIQSSTSYWTWDREADHAFGLLTLYLDKQHEGTRWSQVFAASGTKPSNQVSDAEDIEVPETLDPSELYHIRESLEKYTTALQKGEDPSGLGLGHGVPSLGEGEIDEEIDSDIGDSVMVTWVGEDGSPPWASNIGMDSLLTLLSTPLQGTDGTSPSLVIKNGVDGALFTLGEAPNPSDPPVWSHSSTFSALSFVLASKRDTRFVHHISSRAVLAFESGARGLGGNIYMYRNTSRVHDQYAQQAVLKIGGGSGGSLLGVGLLKILNGKSVVCCLCEGEFVILREII